MDPTTAESLSAAARNRNVGEWPKRIRYGSSGAIVEDFYARRGKVQRYKLVVPPTHGYGRFVAYFATKKHAFQTARNLKSAGY
jgi:hypothetical protein